jgi:hypothetical protein
MLINASKVTWIVRVSKIVYQYKHLITLDINLYIASYLTRTIGYNLETDNYVFALDGDFLG